MIHHIVDEDRLLYELTNDFSGWEATPFVYVGYNWSSQKKPVAGAELFLVS